MSARVIESSYESKRDIARLTTSNSATPLKKVADGAEIEYDGYVIQEITNELTGETFNSILIKSKDGTIYATRSESFIRSLREILDICADDEDPIVLRVERLESNKGNEFITCALV